MPQPRLGAARDLVLCWLCRSPSLPVRQDGAETLLSGETMITARKTDVFSVLYHRDMLDVSTLNVATDDRCLIIFVFSLFHYPSDYVPRIIYSNRERTLVFPLGGTERETRQKNTLNTFF